MISEIVQLSLQNQFVRERQNQAEYQAIADRLEFWNWPGSAHWFAKQAAEEGEHARKIAGYLIDQNFAPEYEALSAVAFLPGLDFQSPAWAFARADELEEANTLNIHQLYRLANQEDDPATHEFMLWFVREQVEEERRLTDILQELSRATCPAALLLLDREYGKR